MSHHQANLHLHSCTLGRLQAASHTCTGMCASHTCIPTRLCANVGTPHPPFSCHTTHPQARPTYPWWIPVPGLIPRVHNFQKIVMYLYSCSYCMLLEEQESRQSPHVDQQWQIENHTWTALPPVAQRTKRRGSCMKPLKMRRSACCEKIRKDKSSTCYSTKST